MMRVCEVSVMDITVVGGSPAGETVTGLVLVGSPRGSVVRERLSG